MTFEALCSAVARDDGISAPAALEALMSGAHREIHPHTASARTLRTVRDARPDMLVETGPRRPGFVECPAQAVDEPDDAGDVRVHMALVTDPPRRFHVCLSEGRTECVGVREGRVDFSGPGPVPQAGPNAAETESRCRTP